MASPLADDAPSGPERSDGGDRRRPLGSRYGRGARLARLSASTGAGYVGARLRGLGGHREQANREFHAATAERVVELLGSMKGAAMKLGQLASFVDLDLPDDVRNTYHEVLADLRRAAPPVAPGAIADVIAEDFGAPPQALFAWWDEQPLASASIGQVHRARLPDGTAVVTKVQYPGVAEAVEADLANAGSFAPLARLVSPNLDVRALMSEVRDRLSDELDYQREARYQQAFHDRYDGHPWIRIPRVHHDWCRPRVLVVDEVVGTPFDEVAAHADQPTRDHLGELLFRFIFGSLHRFRLFHADPHPGNYVLGDEGTLWVLDFGSVKVFPQAARDALETMIDAIIADDWPRLSAALRDAGFVPEGVEPDWQALARWFEAFHRPVLHDQPFTYTPAYAAEIVRECTDLRIGSVEALRRLTLPADYLLLNRIQWGVNSLLGRLHCRANWHRISAELRSQRGPATGIGRDEQPFVAQHPLRA